MAMGALLWNQARKENKVQKGDHSCTSLIVPVVFAKYRKLQIQLLRVSSNDFDPSWKIGEGRSSYINNICLEIVADGDGELDAIAFVKSAVTVGYDRRLVDEEIFAAIVELDEAETLVVDLQKQ
ncbi:hypothetical protein PIB30_023466 [Stylosanthes scabra]|uniref:Uncharacterized protein n=1 Tax=Stylosanthes scabra TaxID=79078 RepID=A0ABU6R9P6_9FABA|nr:hypothetical protein [Stylosanthes scabra]